MDNLRKLTQCEIDTLKSRGCDAQEWDMISVSDKFDANKIRNCLFKGKVDICGDVYINNIGSHISHCRIEDGAYIENVAQIECTMPCHFGCGTKVKTINEGGGREVILFDELTAQTAYVMAMYKHRPETLKRIEDMIADHIKKVSSDMCHIGRNAKLTNCGIIRNANIGEYTEIEGATIIENGMVISHENSKSVIGADTKMYNFIMLDSSIVNNGALIKNCFIGQGVKISALSATDTLFFANSHFENGETCSVYAGPFSVSHHKASLLIAGMFSFFNAGSATNMSNHLFKSGPVHQGIYQRGCKFASGSYMMEPAKIGAFSVILGHHKSHPDSEELPFSYLVENNGTTFIMPAYNLTTYGTVRDIAKWPNRDNRKGTKNDIVNYTEANPFICERMINGWKTLLKLASENSSPEKYIYKRMAIKPTLLKRGTDIYEKAIYKYLAAMLEKNPLETTEDGEGHWIDAGGELMPKSVMTKILDDIDSGKISSIKQLNERFTIADTLYDTFAHNWAVSAVKDLLGRIPAKEDIVETIKHGKECAEALDKMAQRDKTSDFDEKSMIGYGIDAEDENEKKVDFHQVRKEQNITI